MEGVVHALRRETSQIKKKVFILSCIVCTKPRKPILSVPLSIFSIRFRDINRTATKRFVKRFVGFLDQAQGAKKF